MAVIGVALVFVVLLVLLALLAFLLLCYSSRPVYIELGGRRYALLTGDFGRWVADRRLREKIPRVIFAKAFAIADPIICEFDVGVFEDVGLARGVSDVVWEAFVERKFCQERLPWKPWPSDTFQIQECMNVVDRLGCRPKEIDGADKQRLGVPGIIVYCLMSNGLKCLGMKEQGPLWVVEHCLCCRDAAVFSVGYNRVEVEMKLDHLLEYWLGKREPTLNPSPAKCAKCRVSAVCRAVG